MKALAFVGVSRTETGSDTRPVDNEPRGGLESGTRQATRLPAIVVALLWLGAAAVTAAIAAGRYRYVMAHATPLDLSIFLRAARAVAAGHSPYSVASPSKGYVYTPVLAIVLVPFSHLSLSSLLRWWTASSLAAVAAATTWVSGIVLPGWRGWRRPLLVTLGANAAFFIAPVTRDLVMGQSDLFILALLCAAAALHHRKATAAGSALVGLGGVLKVWPVLGIVGTLGHGSKQRLRTVLPAAVVYVAGLATSLAFGGVSGVARMLKRVLDASSQPSISYSVWGIPKLWYSTRGGASVLENSPALRVATTMLLAGLVAWLLWLILKKIDSSSDLGSWNCLACVILLLPASHVYYTVYLLPLLWLWVGRVLASRWRDPIALSAAGALVLWLVVLLKAWPTDGTATPWTSSLLISMTFLANLWATAASVLGEWLSQRHRTLSGVGDTHPVSRLL